MNITFMNKPVTLVGKQLSVGDTLTDFEVTGIDLAPLTLGDTKGLRVFLSVPSIDTGVCSMEVAKFMEYMHDYPGITCYSVSMDLPFALERWCQAKGNENVVTASDYKGRSFAQATGTYIEELGLLARAVFVVDENNKVLHVEYVSEVSNEPDYDKVLEVLKQNK